MCAAGVTRPAKPRSERRKAACSMELRVPRRLRAARENPARRSGRGVGDGRAQSPFRLVGRDQIGCTLAVLVVEEVRKDRRVEARVVELEQR